jgi:hypothetical protein
MYSFNSITKMIYTIFKKILISIQYIFEICGFYILWITIHHISGNLYTHMCVPYTLKGFLLSPFLINTPHCIALRWVIYNGGNIIHDMWFVIGTWIMSKLIKSMI